MDFKNFIDILSTPKNIGSNKRVLNNFSDLKTSNDYLHIIRLRYDNRWLKVYWDGKLKEVEKDYNFYVSSPIKNKLFSAEQNLSSSQSLLSVNTINSNQGTGLNLATNSPSDFNELFLRRSAKKITDGEVRNTFNTSTSYIYNYNLKNSLSLDSNFSDYKLTKNFYAKNQKQPISSIEDINNENA
jgi:hypothetical protein